MSSTANNGYSLLIVARLQQAPETADEFLAAGVELEEGGEKWRAGDAAKSMRFFMRAINNYDEGLRKYPHSFDLAYNKARVQYAITQSPKLASQLPAPLLDLLQVALQSHRAAVELQQDNADALFNTAQVLTSLADEITDSKHPPDDQIAQAIKYTQEALELFQRCLLLQELRYTESEEQARQLEAQASYGDSHNEEQMQEEDNCEAAQEPQEQWAAIVEPVTKNTLVDTAVAQLETLTTLCNLLAFRPGTGLAWVEEYSGGQLKAKISAYVESSERHYEASLAYAKFTCALSEVLYRSERIEVETYHREIARVFGSDLDLSRDPDGLCSKADALTSFNSAVADLPPAHDLEAFKKSLTLRWQSLSSALEALTAASRLPDAENLSKIHLARGDVEMYRWRLGCAPWGLAMSRQNAPTLLRNAQTYYRGVAALARRGGIPDDERDGAFKEAFAAALDGQKGKLDRLKATASKDLLIVAEDMVDDGLVSATDMESLLS
ncbi:hypothetical protein MPDQ_001966 [Monascus purpureus]|uniref:Uncharacterized protein n=1 Tax=Monascus purpureus TaxID=5098 RepID=A0A507QLC5_MONPU|nr:hypothetical protein MPDQ_001966 [Monascus purpureus]